MNFIESLALYSGLKVSKPHIDDAFFPVVPKKYITISSDISTSKQWDAFNEYIEIIKPILFKEGIAIVEIGDNKHPINCPISLKGATNSRHWSYIVKNSLLHVGPENLICHIASFHKKPFISLYSNTNKEFSFPIWSSLKNQIAIEPKNHKRPSFSADENPKSINKISAEEVASHTLNILGIKNEYDKYDVINIGDSFFQQSIEIVPDFIPDYNFFPKSSLNIRMDYHFDDSNLVHFANNRKVSIVTDKEIDKNVLNRIKPNLEIIYFKVDENFNYDYLKFLKLSNFKISLIAKQEANLSDTRLKFFDWVVEEEIKKTKKDIDNYKEICDTTNYKSSKKIFSKDGQFSCKCAFDKKIKSHNNQLIIDDKDFWEDLDSFKVYNLTK